MRKFTVFVVAATFFVSAFSATASKGNTKNFTSLFDILKDKQIISSDLNIVKVPTVNENTSKLHEIKGKSKFIKNIVPIIKSVENDINSSRNRVILLSKKESLSTEEKNFLTQTFDKYRVSYGNFKTLLDRMIMPPTSLVIAQASLESGWGTSKISSKSNNLFGMKSFNDSEPRIKAEDSNYYRKYGTVKESIYDYVINLSRHKAYTNLRTAIQKGESSISLTKHLTAYCEQKDYKDKLVELIKSNQFTKYDI